MGGCPQRDPPHPRIVHRPVRRAARVQAALIDQGARTTLADIVRRRIRITGIVQGVGFRPYIHGLATAHELSGNVANDDRGVIIEVQGSVASVEAFLSEVAASPPPAAIIQRIDWMDIDLSPHAGFAITASDRSGSATTLVSPDLDVCVDCLAEMRDPADRRYRYPFINCTNCGPRFSIIRETPYDRPATTMAGFEMCEPCRSEYEDPADRRFHAQPNACPDCGPQVWLQAGPHVAESGDDAIVATRDIVRAGGIVAIKGIGGFHLACDAGSTDAVEELRRRKRRGAKPFAVMAADVDTARAIADLSAANTAVLTSRAKPIVLLPKVRHAISDAVAPGQRHIGTMLPYTPLHHLLLEPGEVWVMTSGNLAEEPIVTDNETALARLAGIADAFLLHDRAIARPVDDSVVVPVAGRPVPVRRSRGYAPLPVELPFTTPPMLAVGGELKATLCLASGDQAFMSQHIGDMENVETLEAFEQTVRDLRTLLRIEPELFVADLHPRYMSRRWAHDHARGRPVIEVQHHHAHVASLMTEWGRTESIIGFSFDGTGYGTDGTVWGGEILVGDPARFERVGHLEAFRMPGGDVSVHNPYRLALSLLHGHGHEWAGGLPPVDASTDEERRVIARQLDRNLNVAVTTSAGRLFDAVSSLTGVCHTATYEAQAAMELEALVDEQATEGILGDPTYRFAVDDRDDMLVLCHGDLIRDILRDVEAAVDPADIATRFHGAFAHAVLDAARRIRERGGPTTVGLSGGVFQNRVLSSMCARLLATDGFEVLTHRLVPPNDGGLALGQIAVAARRL